MLPDIPGNLARIRERIEAAAARAGRPPGSVALVAVSKTHPAAMVEAALAAGQLLFGENRVQEAAAKFPPLRAAHPALRLHLIGALQTNKAREAVRLADVIESLDRPKLAAALAEAMAREGRRPALLVQVNTGEEPQKAGVARAEAAGFLRACREEWGLPVTGLMCIPPVREDPRPHFGFLAALAAREGLETLSMGMSGDFEIAIEMGATHVRVGSAIFGARG
jgi:pyridoxal phosphate enzyme (YggS family)